jgi:hypothetical protein
LRTITALSTAAAIKCVARSARLAVLVIALYNHDWLLAVIALIAGIDVKITVK